MGLDMYAYRTTNRPETDIDFTLPEERQLVHTWRKHPNLHGWMEALYRAKGGSGTFNCVPMVLSAADLDRLEADLNGRALPQTTGFFFGISTGEELADDLAFVEQARLLQGAGYTVVYYSWW